MGKGKKKLKTECLNCQWKFLLESLTGLQLKLILLLVTFTFIQFTSDKFFIVWPFRKTDLCRV